MLSVRILVAGDGRDRKRFSEEAITSVVKAHGALIFLAEKVAIGQSITVRNIKSHEELQAKVVEVARTYEAKVEVGIEFLKPAPRFWRVAFPPEDWTPKSPEAKRNLSGPVASLKARAPST